MKIIEKIFDSVLLLSPDGGEENRVVQILQLRFLSSRPAGFDELSFVNLIFPSYDYA